MAYEKELQQAVELIKAGRKKAGGHILTDIINADHDNERAWLWLTACVDNDEERRYCLEQVVRINPNNPAAQKGLARLAPAPPAEAPPAAAVPAPPPPAQISHADIARPPIQPAPARRSNRALTVILSAALALVLACAACAGIGYYYFSNRIEQLQQTTTQAFQVEYIVSGTSPQITMTFANPSGDAEAWDVRRTPYSKTYQVPGMTPLLLVAENRAGQGTVACEIRVNGKTISTDTNSDPEGQATCTGLTGLNP